MTEGIATPGGGWRRAEGPAAEERKGRRGGFRPGGGRRGEVPMVDDVEFTSYYGRPIIKAPVWKSPDVPLYLFLGGAAGTSAVLGAMADLSGRPALTRVSRLGGGGGGGAPGGVLGADPRCPASRGWWPGEGRSPRWASWCTTWAARSGSCTCCGCSSRPRLCRWAPTSSRRSARRPARRPRWSCWAGSRG